MCPSCACRFAVRACRHPDSMPRSLACVSPTYSALLSRARWTCGGTRPLAPRVRSELPPDMRMSIPVCGCPCVPGLRWGPLAVACLSHPLAPDGAPDGRWCYSPVSAPQCKPWARTSCLDPCPPSPPRRGRGWSPTSARTRTSQMRRRCILFYCLHVGVGPTPHCVAGLSGVARSVS